MLLLFPPTGCSRADTLLNVHFVLFFTVFSASRQCCPGGQEQLFLRVMFSAFVHLHWFLQCFSRFRTLFFCTICVFPWFLQCFQASWRCWCYAAHWGGVGWGNHVHVNLITLLRLHHVADATGGIKLRFSSYSSATTAQQLRISNYASATTTQQPRLSNQTRFSLQQLRFSNYASATTLQQPKSTLASATKPQQPKLTPSGKHIQSHILHVISKSHPSGKYMQSHILHVISKSHPLWQAHTKSHLTVHMKIPPPLAGTCTVSSYTSYHNPTPSGKYMHSLILHVISKSHPLWQVHAQSHLTLHDQNPTPSGKHIQSHILHYTIKIPPPLASTCKVTSYTSYQNSTPSGKYMHSLILHVISKSHPLWQVHAQSHLTGRIKIPLPLASTCKVTSYITRSKSHPLWQAHTKSHLHMKIPPPLASTYKVTSYG